MDVESTRAWTSSIILSESSHPPLHHESQNYNSTEPPPLYPPHTPPGMSADTTPRAHYNNDSLYNEVNGSIPRPYPPIQGPATHTPGTPVNFSYSLPPHPPPYPTSSSPPTAPEPSNMPVLHDGRHSPKPESYYVPNAAELYSRAQVLSSPPSPSAESGSSQGGAGANHYPSSSGVPRLPPILQVEKQQVTTSATQLASASRRRNEAHFVCPVPGCGSTFTRRFNLRGHLRSHTEERPYICEWPGCKKGFARQHDCKRHQALHNAKSQSNVCQGCKKTFSRLDALNRHLRSEGGADCRASNQKHSGEEDNRSDHSREHNMQ